MFLLESDLALDPNWSRGGGEITVIDGSALEPEVGPLGTARDLKDLPASDRISIYVVRQDDTLSEIAEMFQVSVNTIIWANDLRRATDIKEGQLLVILPITGVRHIVVKGDTLQGIVKKYRADLEEIIRFNDLESDAALAVGTVIIIPDGEVSAPAAAGQPRFVRGGGPEYAGYYLRPIRGGVKTQGLHGYNGVDLAIAAGEPIYAAADGRVIISRSSGWNGGYGNYIVVKHDNGTQTLYAHNQSNIVSVNQAVVQGQVIGYIGSTGKSTGPHVHFEVRGAKNPF
ncbi:MAG: peptidoglycan DD-metalloendopeptidase family protein [Candidatus Vogelbacteria bacterium]|nr:peptidoglycan DD-metalloendopeptidase family protein [Candidatus Vogelbacteria bacterium]